MHIPKYRLHKSTGTAVVESVKLFGAKRRVHLPGKFNSRESKAAYRELVDRYLAEKFDAKPLSETNGVDPESGLPPTPETCRIERLVRDCLRWAEKRYGKGMSTEYSHLNAVCGILLPKFGDTLCKDFGPVAFKKVRQRMVGKGWARTHVNHQSKRLIRVFRFGVENEMVDPKILAALREVPSLKRGESNAPEPAKVKPIGRHDVDAVLPYMTPTVRAMVEVQWWTGVRSGELCDMRGQFFERKKTFWVYEPVEHKNAWRGKSRVVVLGPHAIASIEPYFKPLGYIFTPGTAVEEQRQARAAASTTKKYGANKAAQPIPRRTSAKYTPRTYRQAILHAFAKAEKSGAKFTRWHPHQLRHSRSTLVRAQFGIEGAQVSLGNTLGATELYAERSLKLAIRIARETG